MGALRQPRNQFAAGHATIGRAVNFGMPLAHLIGRARILR